jgi:hypothetical protein
MRRSGISQINAAITRTAWAIEEKRGAARIAMIYNAADSLPSQSRTTTFFKTSSVPAHGMIDC